MNSKTKRSHLDSGPGTNGANEVGQASSLSDERASASMTLLGYLGAARPELNARATRSSDRLEACPTFKTSAVRRAAAASKSAQTKMTAVRQIL